MQAFHNYLMLSGKDNKDDSYKRSLLLAVVNGLMLKDDKFETLIDGLNKFLKPIKSVFLERDRFF